MVNFSGTVNTIYGTPGITNGAYVSGSFTLNPSSFNLILGNGSTSQASIYSSASATATVGGSTFTGMEIVVDDNGSDINGNSADFISVQWRPGNNDGIDAYYHLGTITNTSLLSAWTMLDEGLSGSLTYTGDAVFYANFNSAATIGV